MMTIKWNILDCANIVKNKYVSTILYNGAWKLLRIRAVFSGRLLHNSVWFFAINCVNRLFVRRRCFTSKRNFFYLEKCEQFLRVYGFNDVQNHFFCLVTSVNWTVHIWLFDFECDNYHKVWNIHLKTRGCISSIICMNFDKSLYLDLSHDVFILFNFIICFSDIVL